MKLLKNECLLDMKKLIRVTRFTIQLSRRCLSRSEIFDENGTWDRKAKEDVSMSFPVNLDLNERHKEIEMT